jgi:RecB family exonuclease
VRHWSYSSLSTFEQCPRRWYHQYRDGIRGAPSPALDRGTKVHEQLEHALRAPKRARARNWLDKVVNRYREMGRMEPEAGVHLDRKWKRLPELGGQRIPLGTYVTGRVDVLAPGFIADWKTGKIYASKHEDQMHLYATMLASVTGILRWKCELVYTDQDHVEPFEIHFDDPEGETLAQARKSWDVRAGKIRSEKKFPKQPSPLCGWCPASQRKGGPCDEKR